MEQPILPESGLDLLMALAESPTALTQTQIAEIMGVSKQRVNRIAVRLICDGFLRRGEGRTRFLRLTDRGWRAVRRGEYHVHSRTRPRRRP